MATATNTQDTEGAWTPAPQVSWTFTPADEPGEQGYWHARIDNASPVRCFEAFVHGDALGRGWHWEADARPDYPTLPDMAEAGETSEAHVAMFLVERLFESYFDEIAGMVDWTA